MNSGTSSTELNDMLTNFVSYVDSFYGVNDPLYPLVDCAGQSLTKMVFVFLFGSSFSSY